ncbi:MAG: hypothetical protein ABIM88_08130 [candidate division WOR-3 bacterium]
MFLVLISQIVQSGSFVLDLGTGRLISEPVSEAEAQAFPPPQELLQNTGFETGSLAPWYQGPGNHWVITTTFPHSGTYCATDTGNYWIRQDFTQPVPTESIVSITIWSRQAPLGGGGRFLQAFDLMYSDLTYYENVVYPDPTWRQWNITSWLTMGKQLSGLRIWGFWCSDTYDDSTYIDDISIIANMPLELEGASPGLPIVTLSAWPSAFSQTCRVDVNAPYEARLCLYNSSGVLVQELWRGRGKGTVWIGSELGPGGYFLILDYGRGRLYKNIIKR